MSHARKQIRDAIVAALDEITDVTGYVYPYRTVPHVRMPDIIVRTDNDEVIHELDTIGIEEMHGLTVTIEVRHKANDTIDDEIDALCASVEKKMRSDAGISGVLKHLELIGTNITIEGETDKAVGMAAIEYEAWYRVARTDPETIIT